MVRLVLVPAVMELLGKANWWLPGWLDRLRPPGGRKFRERLSAQTSPSFDIGCGALRGRSRPLSRTCIVRGSGRLLGRNDMAGEPDGSEDTVRGMFGPDVTFLGVPRAELGELAGLDVVFLGAPYDAGTSHRPGARFGPQGGQRAGVRGQRSTWCAPNPMAVA